MPFPTALTATVVDGLLTYLNRQTVDREPTDEEIRLRGDARRLQAALAQEEADAIEADADEGP